MSVHILRGHIDRFNSGTGHYTQVVWADTEELGCGLVYYKVIFIQPT